MNLQNLPNAITFFRILLVVPLIGLMAERQFVAVLWLFALAAISDALDGVLARRFGWSTRLGAILDPLADKFLLTSSYVTLGILGLLPVWLAGLVIARDVAIIGGAVAYHHLVGQVPMEPTLISKVNTTLQLLLVLLVLLAAGVQSLPAMLLEVAIVLVAFTTLASGIDYVWAWSGRARREATDRGPGMKE